MHRLFLHTTMILQNASRLFLLIKAALLKTLKNDTAAILSKAASLIATWWRRRTKKHQQRDAANLETARTVVALFRKHCQIYRRKRQWGENDLATRITQQERGQGDTCCCHRQPPARCYAKKTTTLIIVVFELRVTKQNQRRAERSHDTG